MDERLEFSKNKGKLTTKGTIITDNETNIEYLLVSEGGIGVALVMLADENGKPKISRK